MKILAFDIGGTSIKYGVTDEKFKFIEKKEIPTEAKLGGQHIVNKLINIISEHSDIDRIGISTAGQIDSKNGIVVHSTGNIPYYTGMMIKAIIEDKFDIPTYVENDVNAAAIGEYMFGAAKGTDNFICLTYGTGIGGAIVTDGKLYKGSTYSSAEIGHMITHADGKPCNCGGNGCYEAYASTKALIYEVKESTGLDLNGKEIFKKENFENEKIRKAIDEWINEIIVGLINVIYIFNPPLIVLGGGIMNEPYIMDLIDRNLYSKLMENYKDVKIVRAKHKNDAGILGIAYLASKM